MKKGHKLAAASPLLDKVVFDKVVKVTILITSPF
jgi:hypothetical protein